MKAKIFIVEYTKAIGGVGRLFVKARNENEALSNAKNICFTGRDFKNAVETSEAVKTAKGSGVAMGK